MLKFKHKRQKLPTIMAKLLFLVVQMVTWWPALILWSVNATVNGQSKFDWDFAALNMQLLGYKPAVKVTAYFPAIQLTVAVHNQNVLIT